mgnify:CR=1 FL=1
MDRLEVEEGEEAVAEAEVLEVMEEVAAEEGGIVITTAIIPTISLDPTNFLTQKPSL